MKVAASIDLANDGSLVVEAAATFAAREPQAWAQHLKAAVPALAPLELLAFADAGFRGRIGWHGVNVDLAVSATAEAG